MSLPRRQLGLTGLEVSLLGYGGSPLGAIYDAVCLFFLSHPDTFGAELRP